MATSRTDRIVKNTLMLYIRMAFTMLVSLYTSRVILNTLGETDYGIQSVVAGTVSFLSFFVYSMSSATQRFLNVAMGKNNEEELRQVFSISLTIHFIILVLVVVVGEVVGLWLLYNKLAIPAERMNAAFWIFQFTIITTATTVMSIPYNSLVITHEKMGVFAYLSILNTVLKLVIVYLLVISPYDKLITYGFMYMCVSLLNRGLYTIYCKRHFSESKFSSRYPKKLFKDMLSFSGWDLFGVIAWTVSKQGSTILINMFFGPVVNTAKAIAEQVREAINGFSSNFLMALRPQITKAYAAGDKEYLHKLMFTGAKMPFVLLYTIALPLFFKTHFVLELWLKIVPNYCVIFLQIVLVEMILSAMMTPLNTAALATGRIRYYGFVTSVLTIMEFPICYFILKLGGSPISVFITSLCILILKQIIQFVKLRELVQFSYLKYFKEVQSRCIIVVCITVMMTSCLENYFNDVFFDLIKFCFIICSITIIINYIVIFNKVEKKILKDKFLQFYKQLDG